MGSVQINHAQLRLVFQSAAVRWADEMGRRVVNAAKARAPVDTGRLRGSISHTVTLTPTTCVLTVGADVPYARYVHEGTGIHGPAHRRITPTSKKALKFPTPHARGPHPRGAGRPRQADRGFVFATSVAGQPPNPFLTDALVDVFGPAVHR